MEFSSVRIDRPVSVTLSLILIVLYAIWFVTFIRPARHTAALMPLTMPPLLLGTFATWIGYANVVRGLSVTGDGRAATAAGVAEALDIIRFGAASTAFCAAIATIAVIYSRHDAIASFPRAPIVVSALCWAASIAALLMPFAIPERRNFAVWNGVLIGAFVTLALLIPVAVAAMLGQRRTVQRRHQRIAMAATLILALAEVVIVTVAMK